MLGIHAANLDHHLLSAAVVVVEAELTASPGEAVVDGHAVLVDLALSRATSVHHHRPASIAAVSHVVQGLAAHDHGRRQRRHVDERLSDRRSVQHLARHRVLLNDVRDIHYWRHAGDRECLLE